jgi:chorismate synthase
MSFNTFGKIFRFTTWGESHGPAIGCVVDGCPPNISISEKEIQKDMDRRRPGQSKFTTQRKEEDKVIILSGVFEGKTTGTPISIIIYNKDTRSRDYESIKNKFRPGHADFTYFKKYGIRDYKGGGRQSARETACRVAAGAVAKIVLNKLIGLKFNVIGAVTQLGVMSCDINNWKDSEIRKNPFFCPDKKSIKLWEKYLLSVRKAGSSCGAIIELRASGIPTGLGAPIYSKLDTDIAAALMSINAVKGVNIGSGMSSAYLGGILGGISSGQDIVASFSVKPTSSILSTRETINKKGENAKISVKGRHDPCVGIRAVPIGEAMLACVLLDHYLMNRAQCG